MASTDTEQQEYAVALLQPELTRLGGFWLLQVEEAYTTDGSLGVDGNPALKHLTGGWRACRPILGTEFCYCLAYYGITFNLVTYLTAELHQSNVAAANNVSTWQATCFLTPLAGAVAADSYWGRYRTMVVSCCIGVASVVQGMLMAALSALLPLLIKDTSSMASAQEIILFLGLYMIAFGVGGLRPCLMSFGADQFDDGDTSERISKGSYFNWYIFTMNCASVISTTAMVWVQDHYGWALGLGIPAMVLAVGLSCLVAASRAYRFQTTRGSPLTRVCQVVVAAVRKFSIAPPADMALLYDLPEDASSMKGVQRIEHTADLRFFDKAAVVTASDEEAPRNPWRLCVVTQVEELKILVRMLPLWACVAFYYTATAQANSTFVEQGMAMDTRVGSFHVPPASLATFQIITTIVLIPLYDRAFVPAARRLTGREKGISDLLRIGGGLAMAALAMAAAALVETKRARAAHAGMEPTSILWQAPQYVLVGVGEVLATVGQLDFFYSQAPPAMKTVCTALGFISVAAGEYLSSLVVTAVSWATASGGRPGWIPDDLNEGHLDRFFWMMAGLGCLNLVVFTSCAMRYKSRKAC
uniref:Major facilitator superfamily (MFS) profile domain-containing protein n=1 Tax=Oryza glaberrima TaxID=4538 RepID=I1Q535_ORYGL